MKLRTSFFNPAVLRKDITRFAPLWGLYFVGMLLLCVGGLFRDEENLSLASVMGTSIGIFSVINFCYALVCAELLFGDLFNSRLCNALHAMPLRRESWFFTHLVSGLLFSIVPNLIVGLLLMPQLNHYWFVSFIWVGGLSLSYLFFFGAATLSAMCTGSRFSMALVYGLINFLSLLICGLLKFLFEPLLFGIVIEPDGFIWFSPVSYLCSTELNYLNSLDKIYAHFNPNSGWPYLTLIAGVGIAMLVAALIAYRRRHLESAGDFITVRPLKPLFHVIYTLVAGIALHIFQIAFGMEDNYLFLVVGIIAGFLTGQMLLKRTVRVFKTRTFIGLAAMLVLVFGSMGLAKLDVLGIVSYVPAENSVASVSIKDIYNAQSYSTEDPAEIKEMLSAHRQILDTKEGYADSSYPIYLSFALTDGRTVSRQYRILSGTAPADTVCRFLSKPECVFGTDDVDALLRSVDYIDVVSHSVTGGDSRIFQGEEADSFLQAVLADCEAGNMTQTWFDHEDSEDLGWAMIGLPTSYPDGPSIDIWSNAENTVAWMKEHNLLPD